MQYFHFHGVKMKILLMLCAPPSSLTVGLSPSGTRLPENYCRNTISGTRLPEHDFRNTTSGTWLPEHDFQNTTSGTRLPKHDFRNTTSHHIAQFPMITFTMRSWMTFILLIIIHLFIYPQDKFFLKYPVSLHSRVSQYVDVIHTLQQLKYFNYMLSL